MQLYERKDSPNWWAFFTVEGKQYRFSTRRPLKDRKGAQQVLADRYQKAIQAAQFGTKEEITLEEAFDQALHRVRKNKGTWNSYDLIKRQTLGLGGYDRKDWFSLPKGITLGALRDKDLRALVQAREKFGHSDTTINIMLRVLKAAALGVSKDYNVNRDLSWPMKEHFEKTRFLTRDEEEAVLAHLWDRRHFASYRKAWELYLFLVDTGVRKGEALNLRWPQIDLTKRQIEVYRIKTKSLSTVPISDRVHAMLETKRQAKQPFEAMSKAIKRLRQAVDEVCNGDDVLNAQRGKATIHSLRDTYASRLVQKNLSLHKVSKLLGRTTPTMTRKYAHLVPQDVAEEARLLLNAS